MHYNRLIIILCCILSCNICFAQRRKARKAKTKAKTEKKVEVNPMYESMLPNTAKVLFIDSIVVAKDSFLYYIPLNKETGEVYRLKNNTVFTNEFGNLRYIASGDSTARRLASSDRIGTQWTQPRQLAGIGEEYKEPDYPFMASDGTTLYFAAKGDEALGGYDIFTTIFDGDSAKFFRPENMGLPYNSAANEYFMAIDDLNSLGWLVSDRYQPEGRVCVYTFVPTAVRQSFIDEMTDQELRSFADLRSIRDTRDFGNLDAALNRLTRLLQRNNQQSAGQQSQDFVINDALTYHDLSDFRSPDAAKKYRHYLELNKMLTETETQLATLRDSYQTKRSAKTAVTIRDLEQKAKQLRSERDNMAKSARNTEIKKLSD